LLQFLPCNLNSLKIWRELQSCWFYSRWNILGKQFYVFQKTTIFTFSINVTGKTTFVISLKFVIL
jgi:hypothetical protein